MKIDIAKLRENGFNVDVKNDGNTVVGGGELEMIYIYPGDVSTMDAHSEISHILGHALGEAEKEMLVEEFLHKYNNRLIMKLCDE